MTLTLNIQHRDGGYIVHIIGLDHEDDYLRGAVKIYILNDDDDHHHHPVTQTVIWTFGPMRQGYIVLSVLHFHGDLEQFLIFLQLIMKQNCQVYTEILAN